MNRTILFLLTFLLAALPDLQVAFAGTQDAAKVTVHVKAHPIKALGCADPEIASTPCSDYTTEWPLSSPADVYLTVSQADSISGIKGLSCGVDYTAAIFMGSWTFCGDGLEFPAGNWPAPGGGNRMTWETCQDATIGNDGVHTVSGFFYVYAYSEDRFEITRNNIIAPPELQVVSCNTETSDLPDSALSSIFFGSSETGVNPCGASTPPVVIQDVSVADLPVSGSVAGSHVQTHASDGAYQALTERESGGKKSNRYSFGEHRWQFAVTGGTAVTFLVEAYRTDNGDNDDFRFEYSTNNTSFTPILTVNSAVEQQYTAPLPSGLTGTVYIKVADTDQTPQNRSLDTIFIDWMAIESTTTPPIPPVANFTGSPVTGSAPLVVSFTDLSTENPTSWDWDFGDGTSTQQNPQHSYPTAGTYTVSLTVSNAAGSDTHTKVDYITVTPSTGPVIHIDDILMSRVPQGPWLKGKADVRVVDANGAPVANATVSGFFNAPNNSLKSGVTGADGVATLLSTKTKSPPANWCFQVTDVTLSGGTYDPAANVWIERCEDGTGVAPSPSLTLSNQVTVSSLPRNHPNPVRGATTITFQVQASAPVRLEVFDVAGRRVATLANAMFPAGRYGMTWNAAAETSGLYFYRLAIGKEIHTRKMLVLK